MIYVLAGVFVFAQIINTVWFMRIARQNHELSKLLASRNLTEYSVSEARLSGTRPEQKTTDPYDTVFGSEEYNNG